MVRSRWAPPPVERKGPRDGQRMAIGQQAPPAADEIITPWRHAKTPHPKSRPVALPLPVAGAPAQIFVPAHVRHAPRFSLERRS